MQDLTMKRFNRVLQRINERYMRAEAIWYGEMRYFHGK